MIHPFFISGLCAVLVSGGVRSATVSIEFEFGNLLTSTGSNAPVGSLWAIITQDNSGNLPGGLGFDSSFNIVVNQQSVKNDFEGATIAPGERLGGASGGFILETGAISDDFGYSAAASSKTYDLSALGLNSGDALGLYWFPGTSYTGDSNTQLPTGDFEIGGYNRTTADTASFSDSGMIIPPDGNTVLIYSFDSGTTGDSESPAPENFKAVMIPEPSTLLLLSVAGGLLTVRRRR